VRKHELIIVIIISGITRMDMGIWDVHLRCGWYMRSQVGQDPGPQYNLARAWAHYGVSAGGPSVGAIVVWRHHVGTIVGQENGKWIVRSGNDGHAVRTRARSLAGAIAFRRAYASM
jgi:hypothetical protein